MGGCVLFFIYLFVFLFYGGGSENVQEFHFAVARGGDLLFVEKFWLKSEVGIIGPRTFRDGLWPFFFSFL